jgi:RNA-splicing ligase RtcB
MAQVDAGSSMNTAWAQLEPEFTELCRHYPKLAKTNHIQHLGTGNHFIELARQDAMPHQANPPDRDLAHFEEGSRYSGEEVSVTRHGAVSAKVGQLGIVPGSMGARSDIVRGKGHADTVPRRPRPCSATKHSIDPTTVAPPSGGTLEPS